MRWTTLYISACLVALNIGLGHAAENCRVCHRVELAGAHRSLACLSCHVSESATVADPAAATGGAAPCNRCHRGFAAIFDHVMATRSRERAFADRSFTKVDPNFYRKNCNSCHLKGCLDCHQGGGHRIGTAAADLCLECHRGYFVGSDYFGRAPREDSLRYQRGKRFQGDYYLTMRPDIHAEKGMTCGDCHSMQSLAQGQKSAKGCTDCHRISKRPVEHRIAAHLEKLECYACHSAWAPQEYGSFFLRFTDSPTREDFWLKWDETSGEYLRSAYLRKQDSPPLGLNARGRVSPIRPQFIAYYTHIVRDRPEGKENQLLAAEWKAFFPHTIRRGTVMCDDCHDSPRRFLLENRQDRIYRLEEDGMTLGSFWDQKGQRMINGAFLPEARYRRLSARGSAFQKGYLEKWQTFVNRVDGSSSR